jgi:hypothetical protein
MVCEKGGLLGKSVLDAGWVVSIIPLRGGADQLHDSPCNTTSKSLSSAFSDPVLKEGRNDAH